jgi:hypothetical protein
MFSFHILLIVCVLPFPCLSLTHPHFASPFFLVSLFFSLAVTPLKTMTDVGLMRRHSVDVRMLSWPILSHNLGNDIKKMKIPVTTVGTG